MTTPWTRAAAKREAAARQAEEEAARKAEEEAARQVEEEHLAAPPAKGKKGKKGSTSKRTREPATCNTQEAVQAPSQEPTSKRFGSTHILFAQKKYPGY